MGSISVREYIRWLPDPPSENTSTLVLTSPGRRFVDIRMLKTADGAENQKKEAVEWAFAGTSSSSSETRPAGGGGGGVKHSVWRHLVDSRTRDAESVVDEADMFPVTATATEPHQTEARAGILHSSSGGGGGSSGDRTLEKGRMVNPDTGREADYEEMWRDVEPRPLAPGDGIRSVVLELRDDGDVGTVAGEDRRCRRGVVVCLGRYCQGVVRDGDAFALEQWEWEEGEEEQGGWRRRRRVGADGLYLPCQDAIGGVGDSLEVGARVERGGLVWRVVEVSET